MRLVPAVALCLTACGQRQSQSAVYVPLQAVAQTYGKLITTGNHPTPDQHGTGERVGFFLDSEDTIWGLPLLMDGKGDLRVCAPPELRSSPTTGNYPPRSRLIGTTNEPTGWRAGTGRIELVMKDASGTVVWIPIDGAPCSCEAPSTPGPLQRLEYYRLAPASD